MGSLFTLRPAHIRLPDLQPLSDGRFRLTVYLKFPAPSYVPPAYGDLYDEILTGDEAIRYSGLRLINFDPGNVPYKSSVPALTLVYEQIDKTLETQVGKLTTITDENNREVLQAQFIQYSSAPYVKGVIGTLTPPGVATAVLDGETATDEGILRKITRRYVQAGDTRALAGPTQRITDEDGFQSVKVNWIQLASSAYVPLEVGVASAPGEPTAVFSHEIAITDQAVHRISSIYKIATDTLRELGSEDVGDDLDAQLQTSGDNCREVLRRYVILANAAADQLVRILPPEIYDNVFTQAAIVAQKIRGRGDQLTALVYRKFAEVPTVISEPVNMNYVLPALEDGSYSVVDDFPFRSQPESIPLVARMETEFFMGPLESIDKVPTFRPVDEDGNSTNVLTEGTRPSAEEYLGWVKAKKEIVLRCEIRRWQGYIFARDTYYAEAQ